MSVVLGACRHSKQRAIARALKKRAEKQKLKKEAALAELAQYDDPSLAEFTKMWHFQIEGQVFTVVLYLASGKDTVDIFVNEEEVTDVMVNCGADGAMFDFVVGATYKARIACTQSASGLVYNLTIDGYLVPQVE